MLSLTRRTTLASLVAIGAIGASLAVGTHGCGVTPPRKTTMAVGASVTLLPVAIKPADSPEQAANYPNVHVVINYEGKLLTANDNAEVWIYEKEGAPTPLYKISTTDLVNAYKDTNCSQQLVTHLNNAIKGDGLYCNKALDVTKMHYFVLKRPGQNEETATSLIHEYDDPGDQVISIVIPFT